MAKKQQTNTKQKKYRILSIDGGGIRGFFVTHALSQLEKDYGIRILDYFDLVVGTSTGSIISSWLLEDHDLEELNELYKDLDSPMFKIKHSFKETLDTEFHPKYDSKPLEDILKKFLDELQIDFNKRIDTDWLVFATNFSEGKPIIFGSLDSPLIEDRYKKLRMSEIVRASSAAPFYFSPIKDKASDSLIIDGGLWANNPSLPAVLIAAKTKNISLSDIEVLSFGTTNVHTKEFTASVGKDIMRNPTNNAFTELFASSLNTVQVFFTDWISKVMEENSVLRYSPDIPISMKLDQINEEFINFSTNFYELNKKELIDFIRQSEPFKNTK